MRKGNGEHFFIGRHLVKLNEFFIEKKEANRDKKKEIDYWVSKFYKGYDCEKEDAKRTLLKSAWTQSNKERIQERQTNHSSANTPRIDSAPRESSNRMQTANGEKAKANHRTRKSLLRSHLSAPLKNRPQTGWKFQKTNLELKLESEQKELKSLRRMNSAGVWRDQMPSCSFFPRNRNNAFSNSRTSQSSQRQLPTTANTAQNYISKKMNK